MRTVREIADHRPLLVKLRAIKEPLTGVVVLPPGLESEGPASDGQMSYKAQGKPPCDHGVTFDQVAAAPMTVAEVRAKYPRLDGPCPKGCGFHGIAYVSTAHFVYGDW